MTRTQCEEYTEKTNSLDSLQAGDKLGVNLAFGGDLPDLFLKFHFWNVCQEIPHLRESKFPFPIEKRLSLTQPLVPGAQLVTVQKSISEQQISNSNTRDMLHAEEASFSPLVWCKHVTCPQVWDCTKRWHYRYLSEFSPVLCEIDTDGIYHTMARLCPETGRRDVTPEIYPQLTAANTPGSSFPCPVKLVVWQFYPLKTCSHNMCMIRDYCKP